MKLYKISRKKPSWMKLLSSFLQSLSFYKTSISSKYTRKLMFNDSSIFIPLPKPTKELYRVYIMKIMGPAEDFDTYTFFSHSLNVMEVRIQYDLAMGDVYIIDYEHLKMGHVTKMTPSHIKKALTISEASTLSTLSRWPNFYIFLYIPRCRYWNYLDRHFFSISYHYKALLKDCNDNEVLEKIINTIITRRTSTT